MKKIGLVLCLVFLFALPVQAAEEEMTDISAWEEAKDAFLGEVQLDISSVFQGLMAGEDPLTLLDIKTQLKGLGKTFLEEATLLIRQILLLLLFSAAFRVLSGITGDQRVTETGFYILFMLLAVLLLRDFQKETESVSTLLDRLCEFMQIAGASLSLVMISGGSPVSGAFFQQGMLLMLNVTQWVISRIFLPVVQCGVLLSMFDHISDRRLLSELGELMEKFVLWGMKTVVAGMTGVQILKNMLAPAMDTLKRSALGKAAEAIPGIGSAIGGAAQVLLASAVLIRNCMGIVILLVLVVGSLSPLLHMALKCGVLYVLSAVGQPVADRRMLGCIRSVARGYGMYVRILSGTLVLFFLAVALMAQTE